MLTRRKRGFVYAGARAIADAPSGEARVRIEFQVEHSHRTTVGEVAYPRYDTDGKPVVHQSVVDASFLPGIERKVEREPELVERVQRLTEEKKRAHVQELMSKKMKERARTVPENPNLWDNQELKAAESYRGYGWQGEFRSLAGRDVRPLKYVKVLEHLPPALNEAQQMAAAITQTMQAHAAPAPQPIACTSVATPVEPVATEEQSVTAPVKRGRGRPKGARDKTPRKRRSK